MHNKILGNPFGLKHNYKLNSIYIRSCSLECLTISFLKNYGPEIETPS